MLFILYTSGTTAKPKGIVHTTGGYAVGTAYHAATTVFDLKPDDVYWCTADIGWVTGHSYIVYGPLINGTTIGAVRGRAAAPGQGPVLGHRREVQVTILYTAPTAIRTFVKWGDEYPGKHDLSSLRLLGTVGEPIDSETWMWYHKVIGEERCPIVDTWWQTETGHDPHRAAAGRDGHDAGLGHVPAARRAGSTSSTTRATACRSAVAATSR